jgi:hypothetical protein
VLPLARYLKDKGLSVLYNVKKGVNMFFDILFCSELPAITGRYSKFRPF